MENVIGIIFSSCLSDSLMGLTNERPIAILPFGGRYRLLDFPLSNMVNSGLRTVGIITPHNYRPVLDHLGAGKEWLLDRKIGGLFILPGQGRGDDYRRFPYGDIKRNLDFLEKDQADYVILSYSNSVLNIDFKQILEVHHGEKRDITFIYREEVPVPGMGMQFLETDGENRIQGLSPGVEGEKGKAFLDMLIIKRSLLLGLLQEGAIPADGELLDLIGSRLGELQAYGFPFQGYVGRITSVQSYFDCNMDLLKPEIRQELFVGPNKIHTKETDNPPSRYGIDAAVKNSLIASGCRIEGQVENSIIFRQVHIKPGAVVKNSIVMQKSQIGENGVLDYAILDKFVRVKDGLAVQGEYNSPIVIEKRTNLKEEGGASQ